MDMAYAYLAYLVGAEFATKARIGVELRAANQGDDEFAKMGLWTHQSDSNEWLKRTKCMD